MSFAIAVTDGAGSTPTFCVLLLYPFLHVLVGRLMVSIHDTSATFVMKAFNACPQFFTWLKPLGDCPLKFSFLFLLFSLHPKPSGGFRPTIFLGGRHVLARRLPRLRLFFWGDLVASMACAPLLAWTQEV